MTEAFSEQPAEGRAPVGERRGQSVQTGLEVGLPYLPVRNSGLSQTNPPSSKSRSSEIAPLGISLRLPFCLKCAGMLLEKRNRLLVNLSSIGGTWEMLVGGRDGCE